MEYLEGYDIQEKIGEGGMGQVYRALHRRLDRQVAVKRLAPQLSHNQDMLKRFLQEARLQARLPHPNVVSIFDLIENEQGVFLVMEHVEGQTAKAMLGERERLTLPETLVIAEGVLSGLAFMHQNGVVHRDIKPTNIMVSTDGRIKVTDFGIARLVDEESGLTRFGGGIGTLHYMAPELIRTGTVSFSVDIYSLGATLHELLSGSPPFVGNTDLEIMMGHLEKEPLPLIQLPDDAAGKACRNLIAWALAKSPEDRLPSAETFLEEVRRIRAMLPPLSQWPVTSPAIAPSLAGDGPVAGNPASAVPAAVIDATSPGQPAWAKDHSQTAVPPTPSGETTRAASQTAIAANAPANLVSEEYAAAVGPIRAQEAAAPPQNRPASPDPGRRRKGLLLAIGLVAVLGLGGYFFLGPGGETPPSTVATQPAAPREEPLPEPPDATATPTETVVAQQPAQPPQTASAPPKGMPAGQTRPDAATSPEPAVPAPAPTTPTADAPPLMPEASAAQAPPPTATPDATPVRQDSGPAPDPALTRSDASPPPDAAAPRIPAAASPMPQAQKPAMLQTLYIAVDDARLREQPSDTAEVLARLSKGTRVIVFAKDGDWLQISEPGGRTGFVSAKLAATNAPPAPPVPASPGRAATKQAAPRPAAKPDTEPQSGWRIIK